MIYVICLFSVVKILLLFMSVLTDAYSNPTKCCDFLISHLPVTFQVKCYAKSYYVPSFSCSFH